MDCPELISAYEEARLKRERETPAATEAVDEGQTTRKRSKRGDKKKNKLEVMELSFIFLVYRILSYFIFVLLIKLDQAF